MTSTVSIDIRGNAQIMTLNHPERRNAATHEMAEAMAAALDALDENPVVQVGIVTGAGGTFCSGMDLKSFLQGNRPFVPGRGFCGITQKPPRKPLIAAVEGHAVAGGFEIALACDMIVATSTAQFGLPEVKRGLVAVAGGLLRLPKRLPYHIAMECILTGENLSAERAYSYGLVNRLVDPGQALVEALKLGDIVAANGPMALAASKRVVQESSDWSQAEMFERQAAITDQVFVSQDAREGATAFAEKRKPVWMGH